MTEHDAEYWMSKTFELWKLLDDIDTASDMFKSNYEALANFVCATQQKRWNVLEIDEVNLLYEMFYDPATDILPPLEDEKDGQLQPNKQG